MYGRQIKHAKFHVDLFISGPGVLGKVLPPLAKTLKDFSMTYTPEGVHVKVQGAEAVVPWPNVVIAELYPEPVKKAEPTKVA